MFVADKKFSNVKALLSLMTLESMCKTSVGISNLKDEKAEECV